MASERTRAVSKALLGNRYRAEVAAAIHTWGDDRLNASAVADFTGIRYPRVQEELKRLEDAGYLQQVEEAAGQTVEYKAAPSVYWEMCGALFAELMGQEADA